jgi:CubicO group peptidase (beta-lactamase class C family)
MADDLAAVLANHTVRWPGTAAVGVVSARGVEAVTGPVERVAPWASVTKLVVALACLVATEEGTVALDDYAGPPGATLAHLLAHASGLPFEGHQPISPPGRRRIYSNTGTEMAAEHLESRAGMTIGAYLDAGVLGPLGMAGTVLTGSAAHSAQGPLVDLLALAAELLSPTLIGPATHAAAVTPAWPDLAGVVPGFGRQDPCPWGLGPEVRGAKTPHWTGARNSPATYGHFGQSGSFLWVDPLPGLAMVALSGAAFGPWAGQEWPLLADAVLAHWSDGGGPA